MITILRTDSQNKDFIELVKSLDAFLTIADGDDHEFYHQYNNIDVLKHVVIALKDGISLGCGAIKEYDKNSVEIKRMYVNPKSRGYGVAAQVLKELEVWAQELGYKRCILETGIGLENAINLYKKNGYISIPNFAPYENTEESVCFEKDV